MPRKNTSPFGYDDDDDAAAREADQRLVDRMGGKDPAPDIEGVDPPDPDPETGALDIDVDDRKSRLDKKRERYEEMQRERDEAAERLRRIEEDNRTLREQLLSPHRQPSAADPPDPTKAIDDKIGQARKRQIEKYEAFAAKENPTPEEVRRYREEGFEVEQEIYELAAQKALARERARSQGNQLSPEAQALIVRHYDVLNHPQAKLKAHSIYLSKVAADPTLERRPEDASRAREESFEQARREFRLGQYGQGPPSDVDHARHGGGGPRGPARPGSSGPKTIRLSEMQQRMADEAFPHLDPAKRYQLYAKNLAKSRAGK